MASNAQYDVQPPSNDFMQTIAAKMSWNDLSDDVVLDIGCGEGTSTETIVNFFPKVKKVIGIDYDARNIDKANRRNQHTRISYEFGNIVDISSLQMWEGKITKAVSFNCFHQLSDQRAGFRNLYRILKPGGEVALFFSLRSSFFEWFHDVTNKSRWKKFIKGADTFTPDSQWKSLGADYFRSMAEETGFLIILCREVNSDHTYENADICRESLMLCPMTACIPRELVKEYKEDIFQMYLKQNPLHEGGQLVAKNTNLEILLKKPEQ